MSTASIGREEVLRRIRAALRDVPAGEQPGDVAVARDYRRSETADSVGSRFIASTTLDFLRQGHLDGEAFWQELSK